MKIINWPNVPLFKKYLLLIFVISCPAMIGCKKLLEIDPSVTTINGENVYSEDRTAIAAITGIYAQMPTTFTGNTSISLRAALSADEMNLYSGATSGGVSLNAYYKNRLLANALNSYGGELWPTIYNFIFRCNAAIEGLNASTGVTARTKQQLLGEAYFMRGFFYCYLVNLYGDVPLALSTDPEVNTRLARSEKSMVYAQIISDLKLAQDMLSTVYLNGSLAAYATAPERLRPTSWAASALLARAYLYAGNYAEAELQSTKLIDEKSLFDILPLNDVFLKNSKEAIWQLQPVLASRNTDDAFTFIIPATGPSDISGRNGTPAFLSNGLLSAFEAGDLRRVSGNWIKSVTVGTATYFYPFKYKATTGTVSEYAMVFRLAEQYLIRAEARAKLGKLTAADDLNVIRRRAGLANTAANTPELLVDAVLKERRVELFTEWGHRWVDIKRLGIVDAVMTAAAPEKATTWLSYQQWYPLPFREIQNAPNVVQNVGY